MLNRYLLKDIHQLAFNQGKMAFISGPRQCGKTTLARMFLKKEKGAYYNWDDLDFRKVWTKSPNQLVKAAQETQTPLFVFDEIHKAKNWKRTIKGLYDLHSENCRIIVTGSARLNVYKKGGDSLMGRYFHFRLHPLSLAELHHQKNFTPNQTLQNIFSKNIPQVSTQIFKRLFEYGGFPDPYLSQSEKMARIWRKDRLEKIVREDLRDLSRIQELSQIEMLMALITYKVGAPLSLQSLKEDLEVAHDTVKRWVNYLKELYYLFEIKPWSNSISRSLKKEGKVYLWDWTEIEEKGIRFENMVACHLLKACHYWTDTGEGQFDLFYLRNKEKKEIDFLITKDKKPWLPVECKSNDINLPKSFFTFLPQIKTPHYLQLVNQEKINLSFKQGSVEVKIMSANDALINFI